MLNNFGGSSFLVVGTVRDCAATIESDVHRIEAAFLGAGSLHFLVVESDSDDDTCDVLERLSGLRENFAFKSLGRLRDVYPIRTDRIARCRNYYVSLISNLPQYQNVDYVVVADLDGINTRLSSQSVRSCWSRRDWDACTANQDGPYYDIFALRHRFLSPNDCLGQFDYFRSLGVDRFRSALTLYSRMIIIPASSDWIEVDSAFGGLAIYRRDALAIVQYRGLSDSGEEVCEHVSVHQQMRDAGLRIYINPAFINAGVTFHSRYATSIGFFVLLVRSQLLGFAHALKMCFRSDGGGF